MGEDPLGIAAPFKLINEAGDRRSTDREFVTDLAHPQSALGRVLELCEQVELGKRCAKLDRKPVADLGQHKTADPQYVSQQSPDHARPILAHITVHSAVPSV